VFVKKPSFQFYPADWRNNAKLRRCTWEARGAWLEVMCLLHDSEEYGLLRWSLKELAQAIGAPFKLLKELADKDVLKGGDKNHDALVYTPRSGRVDGEPITLIAAGVGACWFSSRMVIDEHIRIKKGEGTRFTSPQKQPPNHSPMGGIGEGLSATPNPSPPARQSDGSTYSSSSSSSSSITTNVVIKHTEKKPCVSDSVDQGFEISSAAAMCQAMRKLGMADVNPGHPKLLKLIEQGASLAEFEHVATKSIANGKGFAYALGMLSKLREEAAAMPAGSALTSVRAGTSEPAWRREQRERTEKAVPGIAAKNVHEFQKNELRTFDVEVKNVTAIALGR
jgi:hypothetical protein